MARILSRDENSQGHITDGKAGELNLQIIEGYIEEPSKLLDSEFTDPDNSKNLETI